MAAIIVPIWTETRLDLIAASRGAVRCGLIDGVGEMLAEQLRSIGGIDTEFLRHLLDDRIAERLLHLIGGDGQILAVTNPRCGMRAKAALLKLLDQSGNAGNAILLQNIHHLALHARLRRIAA